LLNRPVVTSAEADFTLAVNDSAAPWNDATWRVALDGGRVTVERTSAKPDLATDARGLAPIFNGFISPSLAAQSGLLRVLNRKALELADEFFRAGRRPYFLDSF